MKKVLFLVTTLTFMSINPGFSADSGKDFCNTDRGAASSKVKGTVVPDGKKKVKGSKATAESCPTGQTLVAGKCE